MKTSRVIPLLIAALSVSACGLPTRPDRVDYRYSSYGTTISVDLDRAPPAPLIEHPPQTVVIGQVWAPGYWNWQGTRYSWVSGNWQPERPGHTHVASHWERRGDRWHLEPARYEEHRSASASQAHQVKERTPARHIEQLAAAHTPDPRTMEHRSKLRQAVSSAERRTDPSPDARAIVKSRTEVKQAAHTEDRRTASSSNVKIVEKSRTEVTQNAKTIEKVASEKPSTEAAHPKQERYAHKVAPASEHGDANESRKRGGRRDGGNRL